MKDIELWLCLLEQDPDPGHLEPLLHSLSSRPLEKRFPFFGLLAAPLEHPKVEIRVQAVRCLAGAHGFTAFGALAQALQDPSIKVKVAAVEALLESAKVDQTRTVHAAFHKNPRIRQHALDLCPDLNGYALHLLPDPACRDQVWDIVENLRLPAHTFTTVLQFHLNGLLDRRKACDLISRMPLGEVFTRVFQTLFLTEAQLLEMHRHILVPGRREDLENWAKTQQFGELDLLIEIFWAAPAPIPNPAQAFFNRLIQWVVKAKTKKFGWCIALAIMKRAILENDWTAYPVTCCPVLYPMLDTGHFLSFNWIPQKARRAGFDDLYAWNHQLDKTTPHPVKTLLAQSDLIRRPSGKLDLRMIGSVIGRLETTPYKQLQDWYDLKEIIDAALEHLHEAVSFLSHHDDSELGQEFLIQKIAQKHRGPKAHLFALMALHLDTPKLTCLASCPGKEAVAIFTEIRTIIQKNRIELSENRALRLARLLAPNIAGLGMRPFLLAFFKEPEPEKSKLGLHIFEHLAREIEVEACIQTVQKLDQDRLKRLLFSVSYCDGFPYAKEIALAHALVHHRDPEIRAWAEVRVPLEREVEKPAPRPPTHHPKLLTDIAAWPENELGDRLESEMKIGRKGLCPALAKRSGSPSPSEKVCAALLACGDPMREIDRQFVRYAQNTAGFLKRLESEMLRRFTRIQLPLLGSAWLHLWEFHCLHFADLCLKTQKGFEVMLTEAQKLDSPILRSQIWQAVSRTLSIRRWRNACAYRHEMTENLLGIMIKALASSEGEIAAGILAQAYESNFFPVEMDALRDEATHLMLDLPPEVRAKLRRWISSEGLTSFSRVAKRGPTSPDRLAEIRQSYDLEALKKWCLESDLNLVAEAALRLVELGPKPTEALARILLADPPPVGFGVMADTIPLWDARVSPTALFRYVNNLAKPAENRFAIGLALLETGRTELEKTLFEILHIQTAGSWFKAKDWARLIAAGLPEKKLAFALTASPHPHAYVKAVEYLLNQAPKGKACHDALEDFLLADSERVEELRLRVAAYLHRGKNYLGFPILLSHAAEGKPERLRQRPGVELYRHAPNNLVMAGTRAILMAGNRQIHEDLTIQLLRVPHVKIATQQEAFMEILQNASLLKTRHQVIQAIKWGRERSEKLKRLAEIFAWGVTTGRELSGRIFRIMMHGGDGLGFTRLHENKIYISPLPLVREDKFGRDILEGLILHEIGHHLYHRGKKEEAVWKKSEKAGLHKLLNLVSDEHLERNLRALDRPFGDRLKKLAAYGFQHSQREVRVDGLLQILGSRAFSVLTKVRLQAARKDGSVLIENGRILQELERTGMSFARFCRAFRMGLGNRHNDPKVAEALALFNPRFRHSDMKGLYEITLKLKEIFQLDADVLNLLGQDENLCPDPDELVIRVDGISDDELQREVERLLNPSNKKNPDQNNRPIRMLNVGADEDFTPITNISPLPFDAAKHQTYAKQIQMYARRLREYFRTLGLVRVSQTGRVRGVRVDRTRLTGLITRRDPKMLIARETQFKTDLFLGILIDCSSSMQMDDHIEQAKLFGTLLAEAAKGMAGIDVRIFGFTDREIFDAGDANRCAVHAMQAEGGNNDAAGLWHAAQVALASRRKARLLVMISDGSPTECTTTALKKLVNRLVNRMKIACAQIAVRPLDEICFPHYVEIQDLDPATAVQKFGKIVSSLVQKILHQS